MGIQRKEGIYGWWLGQWVNKWMGGYMGGWVDRWMSRWVNGWEGGEQMGGYMVVDIFEMPVPSSLHPIHNANEFEDQIIK